MSEPISSPQLRFALGNPDTPESLHLSACQDVPVVYLRPGWLHVDGAFVSLLNQLLGVDD